MSSVVSVNNKKNVHTKCFLARCSDSHLKSKLFRRWRLEGLWLEISLSKKFMRPHLMNSSHEPNQWAGHGGVYQAINRRIVVQVGQGRNVRRYWKIIKTKRAEGMTQVTEHLPNKQEALSSNPVPGAYSRHSSKQDSTMR
jgi:hypothetical protein